MGYRLRTPPIVRELMDEYAAQTREAVRSFLPDKEPRSYLYDLVADYPRRGGRCMRPAICIASACAHGARAQDALNTATFLELLHNALLVLDDIQDGSEERRGAPTLHRQRGIPVAINVGSTMSILSLVPLLRNITTTGPVTAMWLFERAIEVAQQCAEGQALELGWRLDNRNDISPQDYLDMVLRKTCSYTTMFPVRSGAMIGLGHRDADTATLRYSFLVGAAFQIQDDILNVAGDHSQYGKELGGDLLEGKRTLLTIRLLQRCTEKERGLVQRFMGQPREDKRAEDFGLVRTLLDSYDCIEYARGFAQRLLGAASYEFSQTLGRLPASRDREMLRGLTTWVIEQT